MTKPSQPHRDSPARLSLRTCLWLLVSLLVVAGAVMGVRYGLNAAGSAEAATSRLRLEDIPFDGQQAYRYLQQICAIGPRRSGSPGMEAQQKLLIDHFTKLGAKVHLQRFRAPHPLDNSWVPMANLIVQWHPESKERLLLCTHYDTRPLPDLDRVDPRGVFLGANDGGSGTALLMELGNEMAQIQTRYGVDFVFFDAEEFVFHPQDPYFLGAEYFARTYIKDPPPYRYRAGALLDMIGDADLQIFQERNSMLWEDVRPVVDEIWGVARRLGVREFIAKKKHEVLDDHIPLHNIGRIPVCDLIDFDYPFWHTRDDKPERCSALSLAKVGWVMREWISVGQERAKPRGRTP